MFRGYRNYLFYKDRTNKNINTLSHINTCSKCLKLNPSLQSPALNNIQTCMYCGNPFYIIKCGIK
jgi:hypothetical protein